MIYRKIDYLYVIWILVLDWFFEVDIFLLFLKYFINMIVFLIVYFVLELSDYFVSLVIIFK